MASELRATLAISKSEALNGTSRSLTLPSGRKVTVVVLPGAYNGQVIRVEGQGYEDTLLLTLSIIQGETTTQDPNQELPTIAATNPYAQNPSTPTPSYQNPSTVTPNLNAQNPLSTPLPINTQPSTPTVAASNTNFQQTVLPPFYAQQESEIAPPPPPPIQTAPIPPPVTGGNIIPRSPFPIVRAILLVGLALLVIAGGIGLFFVIHANQIATTNTNATATANTAATVTENAFNVMSTAQATSIAATADASNATATVQAQVAATASVVAANPDPYAGGTLALIDSLHDANSSPDWGTGSDNQGGNCTFTGGAYHVFESNVGVSYQCFNSTSDFSNFAYEVQMQIVKGDAGGILFRANSGNNTDYIFYVAQDGSYELDSCTAKSCNNLVTTSTSSAINQGLGQTNTIAVVVQGNTITLYVNKQKLTSATDNTYSHGEIGVVASPFVNGGHATEVVYSNARLWKL
jgi:hypothetical protein